jgi:addiction module HigA family antidote
MKDTAIHPGEILMEEFLRPHGLTPSSLAERLGLPANRITMIVNGERAVSPETALLLGTAFGTTPAFWLNLQQRHDLERARDEVSAERLARAARLHRELRVG